MFYFLPPAEIRISSSPARHAQIITESGCFLGIKKKQKKNKIFFFFFPIHLTAAIESREAQIMRNCSFTGSGNSRAASLEELQEEVGTLVVTVNMPHSAINVRLSHIVIFFFLPTFMFFETNLFRANKRGSTEQC